MRGFEISGAGKRLAEQFPSPDLLRDVLPKLGDDEQMLFLRQWVSEGIPFAFRECPFVYERLRSWMGYRLNVEARNITIIGSARLGCSLAKGQAFGEEYCDQSDLHFAVISERLFSNVVADFALWKSKVERKEEEFANKYGPENLDRLPANIARGFIDPYKIDHHRYLEHAALVTNTQSYGRQRLQSTECGPVASKVSIRVYADFDAFFRQMRVNLESVLSSLYRPLEMRDAV
jgi:hypothetical protein